MDLWPIRIEYVAGKLTADDVEVHLNETALSYRRSEKQILILDLRDTTIPESGALSPSIQHIRKYRQAMINSMLVDVCIVRSKLVRTVINGILSIAPTPYPVELVSSVDEVFPVIEPYCKEAEIELPEDRIREILEWKS